MSIFTVHLPPESLVTGNERREHAVLIAETNPLSALIFPLLWLLWHRLWWAAVFYLLIWVSLVMVLDTGYGMMVTLITFVPGIFVFLEGNQLRRGRLQRKGWSLDGVIEGENRDCAEIRYFHGLTNHGDGTRDRQSSRLTDVRKKLNQQLAVGASMDFLATEESS